MRFQINHQRLRKCSQCPEKYLRRFLGAQAKWLRFFLGNRSWMRTKWNCDFDWTLRSLFCVIITSTLKKIKTSTWWVIISQAFSSYTCVAQVEPVDPRVQDWDGVTTQGHLHFSSGAGAFVWVKDWWCQDWWPWAFQLQGRVPICHSCGWSILYFFRWVSEIHQKCCCNLYSIWFHSLGNVQTYILNCFVQ